MTDKVNAEWLAKTAARRTMSDYPDGDELISVLVGQVADRLEPKYALEVVAAVLAGVAKADVMGLISCGDEHEWARLSIAAADRAVASEQCPSRLTDDIRCQTPMSVHNYGPSRATHTWRSATDGRLVQWEDA
jgi:hypothetical protein